MTLDELDQQTTIPSNICDPCSLVKRDGLTGPKSDPYNDWEPASRAYVPAKPRKVIVDCPDIPGTAEYKILYPDGHLGAVED